VLPNGYDATKAYPAILVFGGGPQTMNTIEGALARNFQAEAEQRGYIVIGPARTGRRSVLLRRRPHLPEFLDNIRAAYKIDGGKFHVAGPSNGGIAAMHVAAKFPEYFPFGDGVPRLSLATDGSEAAQARGHLRVLLRRRARRVPLARRDAARGGVLELARQRRALLARERTSRTASRRSRRRRGPPVRGLRSRAARLPPLARPAITANFTGTIASPTRPCGGTLPSRVELESLP
jgi:pimeloyl-ACP methyl ester carboxylesterase